VCRSGSHEGKRQRADSKDKSLHLPELPRSMLN
jgi:hypothetical protein